MIEHVTFDTYIKAENNIMTIYTCDDFTANCNDDYIDIGFYLHENSFKVIQDFVGVDYEDLDDFISDFYDVVECVSREYKLEVFYNTIIGRYDIHADYETVWEARYDDKLIRIYVADAKEELYDNKEAISMLSMEQFEFFDSWS